jgi:hypothetical protein
MFHPGKSPSKHPSSFVALEMSGKEPPAVHPCDTCGDHHANNGEDPQQNRTNHLNDAGTSGTAKENETKK